MNGPLWWLTKQTGRLLEPVEREAVLGDIAESGGSGLGAVSDIAGLVLRRQWRLWRTMQPWLAVVGLVVPMMELLFGNVRPSVSVQLGTLWRQGVLPADAMSPADDVVKLICALLLLVAWSGIGGFVLGLVFRRAAWVYAAAACLVLYYPLLFPLSLVSFFGGVYLGNRAGAPQLSRPIKLSLIAAVLTAVLQIEASRQSLAFQSWMNAESFDGRFVWTPHVLPFLAIAWQFALTAAAWIGVKEKSA